MPDKILNQVEIYRILITALIERSPAPPDVWRAFHLDQELFRATREYEPDPLARQQDALETILFHLVDYAMRMPERVDLTEKNGRVREMCEDLSKEIIRITLEPDSVIKERGKLKVWLSAILSVRTCLIYCEETDRHNAEQDELKRLRRIAQAKKKPIHKTPKNIDKWQSDLAKTIFQNTVGTTKKESSDQPSLF